MHSALLPAEPWIPSCWKAVSPHESPFYPKRIKSNHRKGRCCFLWLLPACVVYDSETEVLQWDCVSQHVAFVLSFSIASVASFSRCVFSHCFPQPNRWLGERGSYSQAFKSLYLVPCAFKTKKKQNILILKHWLMFKSSGKTSSDNSLWRFVQAWCVWVFVGVQLTLMSSPNPKHAAFICCKSGNSSNNNKKKAVVDFLNNISQIQAVECLCRFSARSLAAL